MATNPETRAFLEKALQHVLAEQAKVLKHKHNTLMTGPALKLGELASKTWELLAQGFHKIRSTTHLTELARSIESEIDDISEQHWFSLEVCVSSVFERIEESFELTPTQALLNLKAAVAIRNHFHNLRLLLLEQLLAARMLINNNDYGSEIQRVWQEFLQRQLGPEFRVLEGGHILNYSGHNANAQIDLIVVPADAHLMVPSSLEDGKVNVLCDQVIAAIMTTSNLTAEKLCEDWQKLERVSGLFRFTDEFPGGKEQAWPLCYILASQSAPLASLTSKWQQMVSDNDKSKFVPQQVFSVDSGFLYSGATSWPRPRYPGNYINRDQVMGEEGIYAGLGMAWLLTQIRARAKLMQSKPFRSITRFAKLLDDASLKSAVPPTWSPRFDPSFKARPLFQNLHWGQYQKWVHNRLHLQALRVSKPDATRSFHHCHGGIDEYSLSHTERWNHLRWFRHGVNWCAENLVALEEWTKSDGPKWVMSYAVFDAVSGEEISLEEPLYKGSASVQEALQAIQRQRYHSVEE